MSSFLAFSIVGIIVNSFIKEDHPKLIHLANSGLMLQFSGQKIVINYLPIANEPTAHNELSYNRRALLNGESPFDHISFQFFTHMPGLDSLGSFLSQNIEHYSSEQIFVTEEIREVVQLVSPRKALKLKTSDKIEEQSLDSVLTLVPLPDYISRWGRGDHFALMINLIEGRILYIGSPFADLRKIQEWIKFADQGILINEEALGNPLNIATLIRVHPKNIVILPSKKRLNKEEIRRIKSELPDSKWIIISTELLQYFE